jgi:tetratricopeptide (TPR) repeat protein
VTLAGTPRRVALALVACAWLACSSNEERREEHLSQAESYLATGKLREALVELRSALRIDPNNAETNFRIAKLLHLQAQLGDAIFFYGETLRLDPSRDDAALELAGLLIFDDRDRARDLVAGVLAKNPDSAKAFITRSRIEAAQQDVGAALAAATTAIELAPDDPEAHMQRGKVQQMQVLEAQVQKKPVDDAAFRAAIASFERAAELSAEESKYLGLGDRARVLAAWPGHAGEAEQAFRDALAAAQRNGNPEALRGVIGHGLSFAREARRTPLVETLLEALVEAEPGNLVAWSELAKAKEGSGAKADEVFARMLAASPDDSRVHVFYASELADRDRLDEAVAHLRSQAERGVDPPELRGAVVNLLHAHLRHEEAAQELARLEADHPDHPRTALARAQTAAQQGRLPEAIRELRELTGRHADPASLQMLASLEARVGNRTGALAAVDRALELSPPGDFPLNAMRLKGRLQAETGDCNGALTSFRRISRSGSKLDRKEQVLQIHCLYEVGRRDSGRKLLDKLVAKKRPSLDAVFEFVRQEGRAQPERARALLEQAARDHPGSPGVVTRLARLELAAGRVDRALAQLDTAVQANQATPPVLLERARVYAAKGDLVRAQQDALRAFEAQPGLAGASGLVAALYRAQGQEKEAIASFEEALAAGALRPTGRFLLAQLHLVAGDRKRSRELLEALVAERSDLAVAKNDLAYLLAAQSEDLDRALRLAEEASQGLSDSPAAADTLGFVYLQKSLHEPALQQFRRAVQLAEVREEDQSIYHYHLGLALRALGRTDDAAQAFEKALALDGNFQDARQALEGLRAAGGETAGGTS